MSVNKFHVSNKDGSSFVFTEPKYKVFHTVNFPETLSQ